MKPKLPLRATVPMATAASIRLQHLLSHLCICAQKQGRKRPGERGEGLERGWGSGAVTGL